MNSKANSGRKPRWAIAADTGLSWRALPAVFVPALMVYILFGIRIPERTPEEPSTAFYWSVKADFIKFATITAGAVFLDLLQNR